MSKVRRGYILKINGNMVSAFVEGEVIQNETAYILYADRKFKAEVISVRGQLAQMQVYENTAGLKINDKVEFVEELISVELGPGLLGQIFDGLQNPLPALAKECGFFLQRGVYLDALSRQEKWHFTPLVEPKIKLIAGQRIGFVPEKIFRHYCMVPFDLNGSWEVVDIVREGDYSVEQPIAQLKDEKGKIRDIFLKQAWPIKMPINAYLEKIKPSQPLVTKIRLIDSLFPVALGGTYCIPGPFGAGKTVLQQLISRHAQVDIVVIAACGERAGEVVEILKTFPNITDPRTNKPLSDRTVIICNTSSMPVAARESSVYTAVTIAEYYRQMGLNVLLLADSTSRWAQAMREMSGRLEEIPGEEAFPSYLESRVASFYERAGIVRLYDQGFGSVTIGGTVSPAGGNFEEPVTQATLKVVGAFHGLSRERSDSRKYPAIDPLISWSKYDSFIDGKERDTVHSLLIKGNNIFQMMKVIGEEGTSLLDYITYLKAEFFDAVYLQQNAFDPVDEATIQKRQEYLFSFIRNILEGEFSFQDKNIALQFFQKLKQLFKGWNSTDFDSEEFRKTEAEIRALFKENQASVEGVISE
jgi:V/A-type H+/Na+-transporting ATPase subunit A